MKILEDESISKYTTFRMGGIAHKMIFPQSEEELIEIVKNYSPSYIIGGGSNLLVSEREFDIVLNLREFNDSISIADNGTVTAGAGLRLQKLIREINDAGLGGIEYLYSVPGLVGGAVVMNAGRGKKYGNAISDYIVSVRVFENGSIKKYAKEECAFTYRNSVFKGSSIIILSVDFKFPEQDPEKLASLRKERIDYCKKVQDTSKPNFGSVFCQSDPHIMKLLKRVGFHKGKIRFSSKTSNWMLNEGGTFDDANILIERVERIHRVLHKECSPEVIIWK